MITYNMHSDTCLYVVVLVVLLECCRFDLQSTVFRLNCFMVIYYYTRNQLTEPAGCHLMNYGHSVVGHLLLLPYSYITRPTTSTQLRLLPLPYYSKDDYYVCCYFTAHHQLQQQHPATTRLQHLQIRSKFAKQCFYNP